MLELARDESIPLLERLRFLTICSTNLDEFFEVRIAGRKQLAMLEVGRIGLDDLTPEETLAEVSVRAHEFVARQYRVLNEELLPALERAGIRRLRGADWDLAQRRWVEGYLRDNVVPLLTPVGLDPAHPFPRILNKSLCFIVSLEGKDAFGRKSEKAVVQVPRALPRVLALPRELAGGGEAFVLLSAIMRAHVGLLFPGMSVKGSWQFRLTRNSNLWVDEEEVPDLRDALRGELPARRYGDTVRLELDGRCPQDMAEFLLRTFQLDREDLYQVNGPVNLHRLSAIYELSERQDLKYPALIPKIPFALQGEPDMFAVLRRGDVLLHHPYESFGPVVDLIEQAAQDPDALVIKMTLYRTDPESPIVEALIDAAQRGTEVTAVVELRARFDEAVNIDLATRLQHAGAHVVYGVMGFKAHAKVALIVRREDGRLRRYAHLGTGNYHRDKVLTYSDLSLLTSDPELCEDVHGLFLQLTGLGKVSDMKKLVPSPFALEPMLLAHIEREAGEARKGRPARILAKMNALTEPTLIQALYAASRAGVEIDLIVRGICCLRPGVPGLSERIRVRSIVGRFLEHARVFHFHAGGEGRTFASSADWMSRNLLRRVESCFPIEDPSLRQRVIEECLTLALEDNAQAWELRSDGSYVLARTGGGERRALHEILLRRLTGMDGETLNEARA